MLQLLFILTILLYLTTVFISSPILQYFVSIFSLLIVFYTLFSASRFVKIIGSLFLSIGLILLLTHRVAWIDYLLSFGLMLNLLSLFAFVPILGLPIRLGNYAKSITAVVKKRVNTSGKLYMITSGLSYVFSLFMNLATLPITYYAVRPSVHLFHLKNEERFMTRAILHGYSMPLLWTPTAPIVGVVLGMNQVSWGSMIFYLIPLSLLGLLLDWTLGILTSKKRKTEREQTIAHNEITATREPGQKNEKGGRISHIWIAITLFFILILLLEARTHLDILSIVILLVIPFAFIWSLFLRKGKSFIKGCMTHFSTDILKLKDQFFIFLSAGFLISTVRITGTDHTISTWIGEISQVIGSHVFITLLPLVPLAFAFLGLHPAISLSLMAEALDANLLGVSAQILTISMLGGAVASFLMGPYNATIGLMSTIVHENPYHISRWNFLFTSCFIGMIMIALIVLQIFF